MARTVGLIIKDEKPKSNKPKQVEKPKEESKDKK